jgi:hypothetical protein
MIGVIQTGFEAWHGHFPVMTHGEAASNTEKKNSLHETPPSSAKGHPNAKFLFVPAQL